MEDVIARTGWGLYSRILTAFASMCCFSIALAFMNLPIYLPMISCDVPMSGNVISAVDFSLYIGMALGGFFLLAVADVVGRKTMISASLLLIFLASITLAFAHCAVLLACALAFLGAGIECATNVVKILMVESLPRKYRYYMIIVSDIFWLVGVIVSIGFYAFTAPFLVGQLNVTNRFVNWRTNIVLSVILSMLLGCATSLILDSPKYLLFEQRTREAIEVLREIYAINDSKLFSNFQVSDADVNGKVLDFGISNERDLPNVISARRIRIIFRRIHKSLMVLLRKPFAQKSILVTLVRIVMSLGHLPIVMLLARSLNWVDNNAHCDTFLFWHFEHPLLRRCTSFVLDLPLYIDFSILCSCSIAGYVLLIFLVTYIERKFILVSALFLTGIFSLLLAAIVSNYGLRFSISILLVISYSLSTSCADLIILDMFPTAIRGTAIGQTLIMSRLATVGVIKFLSASVTWIFVGFAVLMECGAVIAFALPRYNKRPLVD